MTDQMVSVKMPAGVRWITRRGTGAYAHLGDLLDAIIALEIGGRDAGYDPYLLEKLREALTASYARSR